MIDLPITADHIRSAVVDYLDGHPEENSQLAGVLDLLDAGAELGSRKEFRGHATAGAVLVNAAGRILHIRHVALDRWLLPGGHLEPEDTTLQGAALRELGEETGIPAGAVVAVGELPVHIDVHPIPASDVKGEPEHRHIDFRYLFRTGADVAQLQTEEVSQAAWHDSDSLSDVRLRRRVSQYG